MLISFFKDFSHAPVFHASSPDDALRVQAYAPPRAADLPLAQKHRPCQAPPAARRPHSCTTPTPSSISGGSQCSIDLSQINIALAHATSPMSSLRKPLADPCARAWRGPSTPVLQRAARHVALVGVRDDRRRRGAQRELAGARW